MQVKYVKDKDYDTYMIWAMLKSNDPAGVLNRAKTMGLNKNIVNKVTDSDSYEDVARELGNITSARYSALANDFVSAIDSYQRAWDFINDNFFNGIEGVTGQKCKDQVYNVVLSPFHKGISNLGGNIVVRSMFEDPMEQKRITGHEILMSHLWNIFFVKFPESEKDANGKFWALNEITTTAILGLDKSLNSMWTEKTRGFDEFLSNYPQLKKVKGEVKREYLNKLDFGSYLSKALSIVEKQYK